MSAVITESLCTGCGLCEKVCPAKAVLLQDKTAAVAKDRCLSCGHCAAVCPAGAVSSDTAGNKTFRVEEPAGSSVEQLLQGKRSVREFRDEPIPRAVLEELIRYGELAPSSRNTRG
ncbi:4Fe-4S binding protein, partial [Methanocorpusculum sp.]|nr:4Fe-4S binding protein [Methanocorpusculum sp.]